MVPKVLVGCPVSYHCSYCIDRFLEAIKRLDYENFDIVLVDNSRGNDFFQKLKEDKGLTVLKDNCDDEFNLERVASSRNIILAHAEENNYDYVLMMDSDVIAPRNLLKELVKENKNVISGLFYGLKKVNNNNMKEVPICWKIFSSEQFNEIVSKNNFPESIREPKDLPRHITKEEIEKGGCQEVFFPSPGCVLISRKVFSKIKYKISNVRGRVMMDDANFFLDCFNQGIKMYCRPDLVCDHLYLEKYEGDGTNPIWRSE